MTISSTRLGAGLAAALAIASVIPASAGPVPSSTTGVKSAVSDNVIDVRWRRGGGWHHGGAGVAAGLAAGALFGAGIAAATAPRYYYGPGYDYPAYGGTYAYEAPVYGWPVYAPAYGYGYRYDTCAVDGGYGRVDYSNC